MNIATLIVLAAVTLLAVLAAVTIAKHRRNNCVGCPLSGACKKKQ